MARAPLQLGELDHYTLIVRDAKAVADFHVEVLGFRPSRIQLVNAGAAPPGEHDMLNHVLWLPGSTEKVLVVTEGLTPDSIFSRYLEAYGAGVHHVAYAVDDIERSLEELRARGVGTTSDEILRDPVSGLRQTRREHCGYFLVSSSGGTAPGPATSSRTTWPPWPTPCSATWGPRRRPMWSRIQRLIRRSVEDVRAFVADPHHLP